MRFAARRILALGVAALHAQGLYAHPLGNLGISHHSDMRIEPKRIELRYTLDYAEIPTFQELQKHRFTAQKGHPTLAAYLALLQGQLRAGLKLQLNHRATPLENAQACEASFPDGAAGMQTMRVTCVFAAALPATDSAYTLQYQDANYPQRSGWKEIILNAQPGIMVLEQSVPAQDRSAVLTQYPTGLTATPLQILSANAVFKKVLLQAR